MTLYRTRDSTYNAKHVPTAGTIESESIRPSPAYVEASLIADIKKGVKMAVRTIPIAP
jgi:hypothetical protein